MGGVEDLLLAGVLFAAGAVLIWLGRKQRAGKLRRNWVAGLRTHETLASDEAWDAAHAATTGLITASGVPQLAAAGAIVILRPSEPALAAVILVPMAITLALVLAAGARGHRIAARVNRGELERDG